MTDAKRISQRASAPPGRNRLQFETSPYLLQHADNAVDWYPWGAEALALARREEKPILLSVGYSACHWCHVMERESFDDAETAELMNRYFVCVKVDREERPDVDAIYMQAVQAMTGHGGWPMTVFLTPAGQPFYGGTYFPPQARGGLPGFKDVLRAVAQAWDRRRAEVDASGARLAQLLAQAPTAPREARPAPEVLNQAYWHVRASYDVVHGGFGSAPKFPQPLVLEFLLRHHARTGDEEALEMVTTTLQHMSRGGLFDQLAAGFHRYSVDRAWLVPHFEKMLYDNALLAVAYAHAWQVTVGAGYQPARGQPELAQTARRTLEFLLREMRHPDGGFYAAQDADSEGAEGLFFTWSRQEVEELLGSEAQTAALRYGITAGGNFEGRNVLHVARNRQSIAAELDIPVQALDARLEAARARMLAARQNRPPPLTDGKIIAAWNGLAIQALSIAGLVLEEPGYVEAATACAEFVLGEVQTDGQLAHSWIGGQARVAAFQEDYAALARGLLALYEATFEPRWLTQALALTRRMIESFWDEQAGGFYQTQAQHGELIARPRDLADAALPSGNSMAVEVLLKLADLCGLDDLEQHATAALQLVASPMQQQPGAFAHALCALDYYLSPRTQIAIVGRLADPGTQALLAEVRSRYLPNCVVAVGADEGARSEIGLLAGRQAVEGRPTAYVCHAFTCQMPVTQPGRLAQQLDQLSGSARQAETPA